MEEMKRGRGRPTIDTGAAGMYSTSRRHTLNSMYMYEGVHLISVAATEIPDSHLLWQEDPRSCTAKGKNGILEQLGRMIVQDGFAEEDCIYVANLSIRALKAGATSREIEKAIRSARMLWKEYLKHPQNQILRMSVLDQLLELCD